MRYLTWPTWLFWRFVYLFWYPQDFQNYMLRLIRLKPPWWRFEPFVVRDEYCKEWEIGFSDETYHVEYLSLRVRAHIGRESGKIVGMTVYDERLEQTVVNKEKW